MRRPCAGAVGTEAPYWEVGECYVRAYSGGLVHRRRLREMGTNDERLRHCSVLRELAVAHDPLQHAHPAAHEPASVRPYASFDLGRLKRGHLVH